MGKPFEKTVWRFKSNRNLGYFYIQIQDTQNKKFNRK